MKRTCHYCSRIREHAHDYAPQPARYDLESETPRCHRHWRFVCELCLRSAHFQGMAWCERERATFCQRCAFGRRAVVVSFWGQSYTFELRCPLCGGEHRALDYAEFDGLDLSLSSISTETHLLRARPFGVRQAVEASVEATERAWNQNAATWIGKCGPLGDLPRQLSDPVLFEMLGEVAGEDVLDAGCGEGYLCRLLAQRGARVCGVEHAEALLAQARSLGGADIDYRHASITAMTRVATASFDAIVCNNVLMYCADLDAALREMRRVLRPGGRVVAVMTHPCFYGAGTDWVRQPPDSVRAEEWTYRVVGNYFEGGAYTFAAADYGHALLAMQRTLSDYFESFAGAGFVMSRLREPGWSDAREGTQAPGIEAQLRSLPMSLCVRLEPR